ncbi:MAG: helix-turn-helix domain-containing protein [Proteobacteria bacterium]|nr:helix-turn-helix domain-containing protein [Pseudomonadota bacterium]
MQGRTYTIGELARDTGTKVETVRWYERDGIMPAPIRTAGGHRVYTEAHRNRLAFVRHARELGFSLQDVRELLQLTDDPEGSCATADGIARQHLASVQSRISRLQALEAELTRMVDACSGGRVADCHVIEILADHSHAHCLFSDHRGADLR